MCIDFNELSSLPDQDSFFKGRVFGEISSHVNAHIENGVITGNCSN